ncbi:MAG: DUF2779 domain-containing protein [Candidatus Zambryskibacteria bacterium]|nr:DUF2779 domain-containing protein [Candidatus Zambryskibacteria bacterium]
MVVSKSEFMMFLKHPAWLWLKKFDKDKLPVPDEELQLRFDEGALFEGYAEKLFPEAVKLGYKKEDGDFSGTMYYALPQITLSEIKKGTKVILQGRLEIENITSTFDVLERVSDKTFNLYEIKSSTSVKPEHIPDLTFQTIVIEKSGFTVRNAYVLYVNNKYVRKGDIDPESITAKTEVTEKVREAIPETLENIGKAFKVLSSKIMPDISPRHLNGGMDEMAEWLDIYRAVKGELPQYSILKLCSLKPETVAWLEDNGIEVLNDIPLDCPLTERQERQVRAMRSEEQYFDKEEINNFLKELEYPLHFLDYETLAGVIPAFDGYHPYQQVPFQYSLHILSSPSAELVHKEYLHTENSDPVPALLKHLAEDFDNSGSVVSWSMKFEKARNSEMAALYPEYANFLQNLNDRMIDLMVPFSKGWFVDKDFFGSASIKAVLPALLPTLTYKELDISGGGQAQRLWMESVLKGFSPEKKEKVMEDLRKYCTLDTYAMYAIYKYLVDRV